MFRNVARVLRSTRSLSTGARITAGRNLAFGASWTGTHISLQHNATLSRSYAVIVRKPQASGPSSEQMDLSEDFFLQILESASKASWVTFVQPDPHNRLRRAYPILYHVIMYLDRPITEKAMQQFLFTFNSASVSPESKLARARHGIGFLTKTAINDLSTISHSAPARSQHAQLFALVDNLAPLCEVYLKGLKHRTTPTTGEVVEVGKWQDFWSKAQPIVFALVEALDEEGYGFTEESIKGAFTKEVLTDLEKQTLEALAAPFKKN